ncbi:MAG: MFS transporter [Clostridia bacterium]|nr:MFS transporter [Clostridia bacterium]
MANKIIPKVKETIGLAKTYWTEPPKGYYVPYKEIANLSGAGFGVHWLTLLASTIGLSASNFLVGASIGLKPMDLQIMLTVANIIGIPLGIFRSWYYDNHNLKGGKFLPFIRKTAFPIFAIPMIFVWLPYENWDYITKAVVVEAMYLLLSIFLCFYNESYTYFQQIISPSAQERANVLSISQVIYSLAPTLSNLLIPLIASKTWGLNNIWTYRVVYPIFSVIGFAISVFFFRRVKERLILPKKKQDPIRIIDAVREVAKNKYFWITQSAAWVVFLESGYGVILSWAFVYGNNGENQGTLGLVNTLIGNASLWSMLLAPLAIKALGKRNLLIIMNSINVVVLIGIYFTYQNLVILCVLLYFNTFINTFWNIIQHNISADMRDYHQWKTGVRVDGLFGPLGLIGTFIGFFTGMFYPALYEKMGLLEDYNVLYDDTIRNNLFEALLLWSALGAFLNLVPFFFYDLTENKHKAYVGVLRIRAMFENFGIGELEDSELIEAMEIINEAKEYSRNEAQNSALSSKKKLKERKLLAERAEIITKDLNKFSGKAGSVKLEKAREIVALGQMYYFENAKDELKAAKALPKSSEEEKAIRSDAIKLARAMKESAALIRKYGKDNINVPDQKIKAEIQDRETSSFSETMQQRKELKAFAKAQSIYNRATKPYREAAALLEEAENYSHYDELYERYLTLVG